MPIIQRTSMHRARRPRIRPAWWTIGLAAVIVAIIAVCSAMFTGAFNSDVPVTVISDRSGLIMESGAKVKMRGVEVGRVVSVESDHSTARLNLRLEPRELRYIPANVGAQIRSTSIFGAKYVDLVSPDHPSGRTLVAGAIIKSHNVTSEVNTLFQNLQNLLDRIDPVKLNAVLSALAQGLRGKGAVIGQATTDANQVLQTINPLMDTAREDVRAVKEVADTYSAAAPSILSTLDHLSTTSTTITAHTGDLDALLLSTIGFSNSGIELLASNEANLVKAVDLLRPTTDLLLKYNPEYTCLLVGAKFFLDHGGYQGIGGNGKSVILDGSVIWGSDPYVFPDNLPIVAAKGGPGGKPSCGSLPDVSKNYPVRQLVTNTGFGTGLDYRPNIGLGHPCWGDYAPVTRAISQPPSIRQCIPGPAPGPVTLTYPGGPPYGAPLYGPDGTPLYPPPPGTPPPPADAGPTLAPPDGPGS